MPVEVRADLAGIQVYTATHDPASLAATTGVQTTVTVNGVLSTDWLVAILPPASLNHGLVIQSAWVSANNQISYRMYNTTGGALDAASGTWTFLVGR